MERFPELSLFYELSSPCLLYTSSAHAGETMQAEEENLNVMQDVSAIMQKLATLEMCIRDSVHPAQYPDNAA